MENVVNNPPNQTGQESRSGNGIWGFLGILLVVFAILALLYFGIPMLRNYGKGTGAPQINIPSSIDVNINQPK